MVVYDLPFISLSLNSYLFCHWDGIRLLAMLGFLTYSYGPFVYSLSVFQSVNMVKGSGLGSNIPVFLISAP